LLNINGQKITLAHLSLTLVGLMWVFPFLHYRHQYPLTTFDQEWWAAFLGVLALPLLVARSYWVTPQIPRIVQLPAALILLVLLQVSLGMMAYFDQALLYLLYLLFALLLMMLGARLRECIGLENLTIVLAVFLLTGAELCALIGVSQHYRWHTPFDAVIVAKVAAAVYGNLAQPNHFANYITLGLISLGLLFARRKWPAPYVVLLALPLLLVMTLSGSRSSWFYLIMLCLLSAWCVWKNRDLRPLLYYSLLLLAGFALMHGVVQLPFLRGAGNSYDIMHRMFADGDSGGIRLYLWREAWLIFQQSPWLGAGFGQFAWQHFQLVPELRQTHISGLYNNAHNLVCQLAAEAGIAGLSVLFAGLAAWLYGLRRVTVSAAHWWGYAALGVLGIHSLLEYPLWYAYFLAVGAILLGIFDETRYRLELKNAGRISVTVMIFMGFLSLLQFKSGYGQLKATLAPAVGVSSVQHVRDGLVAVHGNSLLSPYAELFMSNYTEVNGDNLQAKLALNSHVIRYVPIATVAYRQAFLLAQAGRVAEARQILRAAIWSYPANAAAKQQLTGLAEKDPAHFAALLEFALQTEQEYVSAVHNQ
jgi:O-antigen ligase